MSYVGLATVETVAFLIASGTRTLTGFKDAGNRTDNDRARCCPARQDAE
ncbi:hypothetical protein [Izhakiella capsodis]|nr:hypothetical protein [Izhakiella capsodis]